VALVLKWGVFKDMRFENLDAAPTRGREVDIKVKNWGRRIARLKYNCSVEGIFGGGGCGECGWVCGLWRVVGVEGCRGWREGREAGVVWRERGEGRF
jgi:hypothetical protein